MHVFRSLAPKHLPAQTSVTLSFELRRRSRQRLRLDDGTEAGLMLARGTVLHPGDRLLSDDRQTVVEVKAARERLSTVRSQDALRLARACYHLGNRHVPLQIEPGRLCYPHDPVLDEMIAKLGLEVAREEAEFLPEPGAYDHGHPAVHG